MIIQNYSDLTLDGMTLTIDNPNYASAYTLSNNNGSATIKDTTINANPAGGFAFDVCRYASYRSIDVTVTGNSVINGDVEISASNNSALDGFSLTLTSGTMNGDIVVDASAAGLVGDDNKVTKADTFTQEAPADFKWVDNGNGTSSLAAIEYVAQIGNTKYEDLQAALNEVQDGETITILTNIALTGSHWFVVPAPNADRAFTIDLDGKTISSEDSVFVIRAGNDVTVTNGELISTVANDYVVYNDGIFTLAADASITDSTASGNGIIARSGSETNLYGDVTTGYYAVAAFGTSEVNVYDGADLTSTDASALSGNGSTGNEGYTFNVYGGNLTSTNDVAIYHPNQGTLNITGGTITGATAIYVKSGPTSIAGSETNISGATIVGNGAAAAFTHSNNGCVPTGDAIVIENCGYPGGTPNIGISGGTISSTNAKAVASYGYDQYPEVGEFVSGGTFNTPVPEEYCAEGYIPKDNGDGTYGVEPHEHAYTEPSFNWTQDAETGDWNCDTLTLTCSCGDTQDYTVTGFFGASAVTCTADANGDFTYSVSKKIDGVTYSDTRTLDANGVIKSVTQLKAAAKKGGTWELGADIDGAVDIQCANGFVLDGNDYTVTRHASVSTQAVFRTTTNPAEITLKNLTIDGIANQSDLRPAIATKMSNPSAGNVINLENVEIINYDFDADNNGVVLAWGEATVNMTDCDIATDSTYDVWGGAASKVNIDGGDYGNVYINGGTSAVTVDGDADVAEITLGGSTAKATVNNGNVDKITANFVIQKEAVIMDPLNASVQAPEGYEWVDSATAGMKTLAKAEPETLFVGRTISLNGYIDLNFYLNPNLVGEGTTVNFAWTVNGTNKTASYTLKAEDLEDGKGYKATVSLPAAEMNYGVTASVEGFDETKTSSVRDYCDYILAKYEDENLINLVKALLNYGAAAQTAFNRTDVDLVNTGISYDGFDYQGDVTDGMITQAISDANNGAAADDLAHIADSKLGAKYYTTSLIYLSGSTLRHYFTPKTWPGTIPNASAYDGNQSNYYYYVEKTNIPAAELDTLQTFTVGDVTFKYSALDYVRTVLNSTAAPAAKELAVATYWYNQAANAYFTD